MSGAEPARVPRKPRAILDHHVAVRRPFEPAPLRDALEVWKDITFNYESTDSPDFVPTATPAM